MNPLVPADLDLRDFPFMPVDIARLLGSQFHAISSDAAWRAGVTLWLKSYHQVPASSLPDDDIALARLAELGRDVKGWRSIRVQALRGWVICDDGLLYHPVVAEKTLEAWIEKLFQRKSSAAGNAKRYSRPFDPSEFDFKIDEAAGMLMALNPSSRGLSRRIFPSRSSPGGRKERDEESSHTSPGGSPSCLPIVSQGKGREVSSPSSPEENWGDRAVVGFTGRGRT